MPVNSPSPQLNALITSTRVDRQRTKSTASKPQRHINDINTEAEKMPPAEFPDVSDFDDLIHAATQLLDIATSQLRVTGDWIKENNSGTKRESAHDMIDEGEMLRVRMNTEKMEKHVKTMMDLLKQGLEIMAPSKNEDHGNIRSHGFESERGKPVLLSPQHCIKVESPDAASNFMSF
jgi:hypothetical protein